MLRVGCVSGPPKSHQLICALKLATGIFYTMNKRMPLAKGIITYFYCMPPHPLLSSHFIQVDFFQKINLSVEVALWAAALVLPGVYQNCRAALFFWLLLNATKPYKGRNFRSLCSEITKPKFFYSLNINEQSFSVSYPTHIECPRYYTSWALALKG